MIIDETPHAVRWAIRPLKRLYATQWTKWHWTNNGDFTLCGRVIVVGREDVPMFPETDEQAERVDCAGCRRAMKTI